MRLNIRSLIAWPLVCICLGCVLWTGILSKINHERGHIRAEALLAASSQAKAYADRLDRSVGQIDYLMLSLKYYWEETGGKLKLEDQLRKGLVPASAHLSVTILDRSGRPVSGTLEIPPESPSVADRDYFQAHKADPSKGLLFSHPVEGIRSKKPVILLSRRLEADDGSFDGLVVVAIEPNYFASGTEETITGHSDFVSVSRHDGVFFAAKVRDRNRTNAPAFRAPPVFEGETGVGRMPAERFVDDKAHIVAWHKLKNYPLVSIVGLSEERAVGDFEQRAREFRLIAIAASLVLLLLTAIAMFFSARVALRRQQTARINTAYRLATDGAREGFYMMRPLYDDNKIVDFLMEDCNERGAAYYGTTRAALVGTRLSSLFSEGFQDDILPVYRSAMESGFYENEIQVSPRSSLQVKWVHRRLLSSGDGLAITLRDISESKAHEEAVVRLTNADAVTSLPNRHWLTNYLPAAVEKARISNSSLAVLLVDIDDFKNINDTLGHATGDELLKSAALRLKSVVRTQDNVVRLGGDEFTVILEPVVDDRDVSEAAGRIITTLAEPFLMADGSRHTVHASIGISMFPQDGEDGQTLLKHADIAMYAVKANGKRHYQFFQKHLSSTLLERLNKQQELQRAIDRNEFVLHYQPRVHTFSGELCGMEALVRWKHPERGMIQPNDFIPIAEDTGLIVRMGELVIEQACAQLAQWKEQNLPVVPVSINVSPRQINKGNVSAVFASNMEKYGIEPSLIEVEITESGMVAEDTAAAGELAAIEALGVKLYVDDFGTGYSSLSQLRRLDVDGLKVDRAFTSELSNGPEDEAFFRAIVSMAHAIGMSVVAEGVETVEQLRILQSLSCDEVQGYLISNAVPASDVPSLMRKRYLFSHETRSVQ